MSASGHVKRTVPLGGVGGRPRHVHHHVTEGRVRPHCVQGVWHVNHMGPMGTARRGCTWGHNCHAVPCPLSTATSSETSNRPSATQHAYQPSSTHSLTSHHDLSTIHHSSWPCHVVVKDMGPDGRVSEQGIHVGPHLGTCITWIHMGTIGWASRGCLWGGGSHVQHMGPPCRE